MSINWTVQPVEILSGTYGGSLVSHFAEIEVWCRFNEVGLFKQFCLEFVLVVCVIVIIGITVALIIVSPPLTKTETKNSVRRF